MSRPRRPPPPLTAEMLERLALRYVERYATTRAKLAAYLERKIRERGFEDGVPQVTAIVERFAELGYVDDRAFAEARAAAMARRGLGERRVASALWQAGVEADDAEALAPDIAERAVESAVTFARRRRIGPFAAEAPDRSGREKHIAAMIRAGHAFELARAIASLPPGGDITFLFEA
ncbi:RecX family transcriptional regulator [Stakelama saccharophila]|uniref:Regulatory protein RecX n=1 Tax=Stakelama saccharophila TaxID=3075605 RepID=A0ABZ0B767_9SPHN|nr:RecX family transcriptional regulator [Stakelama sp. W311]WNO53130.1 RecX family transcriptional regulator [Stakelama sp. W311]